MATSQGQLFFPEFHYRLNRDVGRDDVESAWRVLVTECPILRTVFLATQSTEVPVIQLVMKPGSLAEVPVAAEVEIAKRSQATTPLAFLSIKQDGEGTLLVLRVHHALYDGVSLPIIMERFGDLCCGSRPAMRDDGLSLWSNLIAIQVSGGTPKDAARVLDPIPTERIYKPAFWVSYSQAGVFSM